MEPFEMMRDAFTLDYEESITRAISELPRHKTCIVVVRDKKYIGIVDDWTLISSAAKPNAKIGHIAIHAPTITKKTSIINICRLFFSGPYRALPVMDDDKLVGVLARNDVLRILMEQKLLDRMRVADVMDRQVPKIESTALLGKAKSRMYGNQYGKLAVTEEGKLAGVLTAYDLANLLDKPKDKLPFRSSKSRIDDIEVSSVMRDEVYTIKPEETLGESAKRLIERDVATLIVESGGKPVGIISARNLFSFLVKPEEIGIYISGLDENDKAFVEDINDDVRKMLSKLKKSFDVEHISLHFKKYGKKYSVHGRLMGKGVVFTASSFGWDLRNALKAFLDDMEKILHREKEGRVDRIKKSTRKTGRWME
ncbi:CBS domain-containing protein [Candidatus Micrarchaeota archaeon]|nr:CBS domain-containing protein [Candidatus Micrarchaeota archaeon]